MLMSGRQVEHLHAIVLSIEDITEQKEAEAALKRSKDELAGLVEKRTAKLEELVANEAGLTQCFSNLLGNAVKFVKPGQTPEVRIWAERRDKSEVDSKSETRDPKSDAGGKPEVKGATPIPHEPTFRVAGEWVRIWVEDKGIGIPQAILARVFDMFSRGQRTYEGTGIGLALVRKVVDRMGGKVGVESEEGKGSRFWLELALMSKPTAAAPGA